MGTNAGGMATTRLDGGAIAAARRAEDATYAAAYMVRTGNKDLLEVLGLDGGDLTSRRCRAPGCDKPIGGVNRSGKQTCCSKACAAKLAAAERQANRNERNAKAKGNV